MASKFNELHFNFPKLAEESGFSFNVHRQRLRIDWNKIRLIDIDNIIRERKFHVVEQHMNCILDCGLENEFDVRILDEGFVKMFRLAQLAVEYQQFCRHYLDRSVHVLREEITALAQELSVTKREVFEKEEEIKKLKKRKHSIRTVPFGNENIANLILRTLNNKGEIIIPPTSTTDILHYNKCNYCEKVFLNQLYLKSHISRRHGMEIPEKDESTKNLLNHDNEYVNKEISELKSKLKNMEDIITNISNKSSQFNEKDKEINDINTSKPKEAKDVAVSTNNEEYVVDKLDDWKKQEHENYNKELALLRTQIVEAVNSYKEQTNKKDTNQNNVEMNHNTVEQLYSTIKEQGDEIMALKQQLTNAKLNTDSHHLEWRKEYESQVILWAKRAEEQSKQYHELLNKLDEVSKDAQKSREQAEIEKTTSLQLQSLLKQTMKNSRNSKELEISKNVELSNKNNKLKTVSSNKPTVKQETLESLQRTAQQLLKEESISSSDNTSQSAINSKMSKTVKKYCVPTVTAIGTKNMRIKNIEKQPYDTDLDNADIYKSRLLRKINTKPKKSIREKLKPRSGNKENKTKDLVLATSPVKVVRAKITEEVNNQLASLGIDPLKSKIPHSVFKKEKILFQQRQELKAKKNPARETARHKILSYLDSTSANLRTPMSNTDRSSPLRRTKQFSLTSVFSNVKNKAMSLVKSTDSSKGIDGVSNRATRKGSLAVESSIDSNCDSERSKLKIHNKQDKIKTPMTTNNIEKNNSLSDSELDATSLDSDIEETQAEGSLFQQSTKSIDLLIKSPVRRPMSAKDNCTGVNETQESEAKWKLNVDYSEDETSINKDNLRNNTETRSQDDKLKMTKGVLKNASSISSLNKKKVIFDMDAIQMKSLSASPSQSITEKSDGHEKAELDILNIDEEWDISSIDNEPKHGQTKVQLNTRTSPKIAELTKTIELQLSRRSDVPSKIITHGIDTLKGSSLQRAARMGGSNTSLGSSILDDSDNADSRQSTSSKSKNEKMRISDFDISDMLKNDSF